MTEARVTRVSSAIDLDLTAVVEETARLVLGSVNQVVAEQTMPALAQIQRQVSALAALLTAPALGLEETATVLANHLPTGSSMGGEIVRNALAQTQAERLLAAGFALVPLHGAALEHTVQATVPAPAQPAPLPVLPSAEAVRNLTAEQAAMLTASMNQVPSPAHLYTADEVVGFVNSLKDDTTARADARLAQANRDPEDSWREQ